MAGAHWDSTKVGGPGLPLLQTIATKIEIFCDFVKYKNSMIKCYDSYFSLKDWYLPQLLFNTCFQWLERFWCIVGILVCGQ